MTIKELLVTVNNKHRVSCIHTQLFISYTLLEIKDIPTKLHTTKLTCHWFLQCHWSEIYAKWTMRCPCWHATKDFLCNSLSYIHWQKAWNHCAGPWRHASRRHCCWGRCGQKNANLGLLRQAATASLEPGKSTGAHRKITVCQELQNGLERPL